MEFGPIQCFGANSVAGQPLFYFIVVNYFLTESISTSLCTPHHFYHFRVLLSPSRLECCYSFLCHGSLYLISLCNVYLRNTGLYFFNSIRSGLFFRFLVVMYREVPGIPESLCSVHSKITCTRLPFLAIFRKLDCKYSQY